MTFRVERGICVAFFRFLVSVSRHHGVIAALRALAVVLCRWASKRAETSHNLYRWNAQVAVQIKGNGWTALASKSREWEKGRTGLGSQRKKKQSHTHTHTLLPRASTHSVNHNQGSFLMGNRNKSTCWGKNDKDKPQNPNTPSEKMEKKGFSSFVLFVFLQNQEKKRWRVIRTRSKTPSKVVAAGRTSRCTAGPPIDAAGRRGRGGCSGGGGGGGAAVCCDEADVVVVVAARDEDEEDEEEVGKTAAAMGAEGGGGAAAAAAKGSNSGPL